MAFMRSGLTTCPCVDSFYDLVWVAEYKKKTCFAPSNQF